MTDFPRMPDKTYQALLFWRKNIETQPGTKEAEESEKAFADSFKNFSPEALEQILANFKVQLPIQNPEKYPNKGVYDVPAFALPAIKNALNERAAAKNAQPLADADIETKRAGAETARLNIGTQQATTDKYKAEAAQALAAARFTDLQAKAAEAVLPRQQSYWNGTYNASNDLAASVRRHRGPSKLGGPTEQETAEWAAAHPNEPQAPHAQVPAGEPRKGAHKGILTTAPKDEHPKPSASVAQDNALRLPAGIQVAPP